MKIILIDHTEDPEQAIAQAAAICRNTDKTDCASNRARLEHIMAWKHYSALRFAYATFSIEGISRVESHQHVRVAHAGILQLSQRYVDSKTMGFIAPPSYDNLHPDAMAVVKVAELAAREAYNVLVESGVPIEDARYILPQGTETSLVMTGNFQMWLQWLRNRTNHAAQWEIRQVALEIARQLKSISPIVFKEFE